MHRRGYNLQLAEYDERGWRATFYTTGMERPTGAIGSGESRLEANGTPRRSRSLAELTYRNWSGAEGRQPRPFTEPLLIYYVPNAQWRIPATVKSGTTSNDLALLRVNRPTPRSLASEHLPAAPLIFCEPSRGIYDANRHPKKLAT